MLMRVIAIILSVSRALEVSSYPSRPTEMGRTSNGLHAMLFSSSDSMVQRCRVRPVMAQSIHDNATN